MVSLNSGTLPFMSALTSEVIAVITDSRYSHCNKLFVCLRKEFNPGRRGLKCANAPSNWPKISLIDGPILCLTNLCQQYYQPFHRQVYLFKLATKVFEISLTCRQKLAGLLMKEAGLLLPVKMVGHSSTII